MPRTVFGAQMSHSAPDSMFRELAVLLLGASVVGFVALRLKQPLIVAFILAGVLAGPVGLDVIHSTDQVRVLAEMGLTLLLFVVGLKLDPQLIKRMGSVSLATGLGQMVFTGTIGFGLCLLLGMRPVEALYVSASLVFSSTVLIIKLLSDKRDTESLYGRIAVGFLIVEDVVVVLLMIVLSAFVGARGGSLAVQMAGILAKGTALFVGVWAASRYLFPIILPRIAVSTELLVLCGISWALALAGLSQWLGFNKEVGAFVGGLSLASTMYRDILSVKLAPLRDFLLLFFFLELGSHLDLTAVRSQLAVALPLSLLVLLGKPFSVMAIMGVMGYTKRTSFMAGLTVAQISEFSLLLVAMGTSAGHIGPEVLGLVTLVLLITMGIDVHLTLQAQALYDRVGRYLSFFEVARHSREDAASANRETLASNGVILVGLGRYGSSIGEELSGRGRMVLGVDFDPQAVQRFRASGEKAVFGDAEDPDFAHALPLSEARWVLSTIRDNRLNAGIKRTLEHEGYRGLFACATEDPGGPAPPPAFGDLLFDPYEDAAAQAADLLLEKEGAIARKIMDRHIEAMKDHYVICGYGRMGQQIVKDLSANGVPCVVVENNPEQLPRLRDGQIPHVEGSAADDETLRRAGIERARGLIAVAASDEANVFIVLTARGLNKDLYIVARSILKENEDKLRHAGADMVMSPYVLGGRRMAAAVIRPEVMDFLDLVVHSDGVETEMAKITVSGCDRCKGKTLRDLNLWQSCEVTLLAVTRPGEDLHANPSPSLELHEGDEVIVMGTPAQIESARKALSA